MYDLGADMAVDCIEWALGVEHLYVPWQHFDISIKDCRIGRKHHGADLMCGDFV